MSEHTPHSPDDDFVEGYKLEGLIEPEQDLLPANVIRLDDFRAEMAAHGSRLGRIKDGESLFRVRDWTNEHKTVTIVGTATAIGLALGGLYAVRKKRKR